MGENDIFKVSGVSKEDMEKARKEGKEVNDADGGSKKTGVEGKNLKDVLEIKP